MKAGRALGPYVLAFALSACGGPDTATADAADTKPAETGLSELERQRLQAQGEAIARQARLDRLRERIATIEADMQTTTDEPFFAVLERQLAQLRIEERELLREIAAHAESDDAS